ncbi:hypothetical protein INS49_015282 [Diaporthe citri]|uniref:uncharacterized protein n=1 Tax=Diaporthe citri TaxID=83186 RepID=UPI001C80D731|nr:uncharacterized protein INS49_015282 [Diaporthe citri]KAG6355898.1 hypothetical protein INS49_015282 [Diaporthe citri]
MAMRHLRRPSVERTLWVDALCINQRDPVERSQQVRLMRDIYARCTVDLAWMLTAQNVSRLPARIAELHRAFELMKRISFKDTETLAKMRDGPSHAHSRNTVPGAFLLGVEEQEALIAAFGYTDIWYRIWTMHELAYAPQVRLVAGPHELDWAVVATFLGDRPYADAFHAAFGHRGGGRALDLFFSGSVRVHDQRRALWDGNYRSTLLDVLARFQQNGATDPRDCVYGILGLVTDQHGIVVDYTKSATQVFVDTAVSLIKASQNLDVLCQTAWMARSRSESPHELPSWVPDFSARVYSDAHGAILFAQRGIYAAGRACLKARCRPINHQFLPVKAVVLGCLRGDYITQSSRYTLNSVEKCRKWLVDGSSSIKNRVWPLFGAPFEWLETSGLGVDILDGEIPYRRTGEAAIRAYWRTLVMDCGAYPIERLAEQDKLQTDVAFKSILEFLNDKLRASASGEARGRPMDTKDPRKHFTWSGDDEVSNETLTSLWESMPKTVSTMWCRNYQNWMFSVTNNGLYIMVRDAMAGDTIVSVEGAKVPLILRKLGSHDGVKTYSLVGTAYVHGFMDGEALNLVEEGALHEEEILLR